MRKELGNLFPPIYQAVARVQRSLTQELAELRCAAYPTSLLAKSFAVGTALSFIPLPVLDTILAAAVLTRFKHLNRASLFMARLIWNDFLVFPLYGTGYRIGSTAMHTLLGAEPELPGLGHFTAPFISFLIGTILLSAGATISAYVVFWSMLKLFRYLGSLPG